MAEFGCDCCNHVCAKKINLAAHLGRKHGSGPFVGHMDCDACGKSFPEQIGGHTLFVHFARAHGQVSPAWAELRRALREGNNNSRKRARFTMARIRCDACDRGFLSHTEFVRHFPRCFLPRLPLPVSTKPRPRPVCDVCGQDLSCPYAYFVHFLRLHAEEGHDGWSQLKARNRMAAEVCRARSRSYEFSCDECGGVFAYGSLLVAHFATQHDAAGRRLRKRQLQATSAQRTIRCDYCGASRLSQSGMHSHLLTCGRPT